MTPSWVRGGSCSPATAALPMRRSRIWPSGSRWSCSAAPPGCGSARESDRLTKSSARRAGCHMSGRGHSLPGRHDQTALEHVEVVVDHAMQDPPVERERQLQAWPVSYTHLTLPTILRV